MRHTMGNDMAANPPTLPTPTENTDIDELIHQIMFGVTSDTNHITKWSYEEAKAAIAQKLMDARIDELKLCLGDKNVMPLDFSDIKDRIAALQASKGGK